MSVWILIGQLIVCFLAAIGASWVTVRWKEIYPLFRNYLWRLGMSRQLRGHIVRNAIVALWLGDREPQYACLGIVRLLDMNTAILFQNDPKEAVRLVAPELATDWEKDE